MVVCCLALTQEHSQNSLNFIFIKLTIKTFPLTKKKLNHFLSTLNHQNNLRSILNNICLFIKTLIWNIAKWQGNRFWYDHSKVRILLFQIFYNKHNNSCLFSFYEFRSILSRYINIFFVNSVYRNYNYNFY